MRERSAAHTVTGGGVLVVLTATFVVQSAAPTVLLQFDVAPCNDTSSVAASLVLGADTLAWVVGATSFETPSLPMGTRTLVLVQHDADGRIRIGVNGVTVRRRLAPASDAPVPATVIRRA